MIITLFATSPAKPEHAAEEQRLTDELGPLLDTIPGFIGAQYYTAADGEEIGVIRFVDREALDKWMHHPLHEEAQRQGQEMYTSYWVQSAETFREYQWNGARRTEGDLTALFADRRPSHL